MLTPPPNDTLSRPQGFGKQKWVRINSVVMILKKMFKHYESNHECSMYTSWMFVYLWSVFSVTHACVTFCLHSAYIIIVSTCLFVLQVPFDGYRQVFPPLPAFVITCVLYSMMRLSMSYPMVKVTGGLFGKCANVGLSAESTVETAVSGYHVMCNSHGFLAELTKCVI